MFPPLGGPAYYLDVVVIAYHTKDALGDILTSVCLVQHHAYAQPSRLVPIPNRTTNPCMPDTRVGCILLVLLGSNELISKTQLGVGIVTVVGEAGHALEGSDRHRLYIRTRGGQHFLDHAVLEKILIAEVMVEAS